MAMVFKEFFRRINTGMKQMPAIQNVDAMTESTEGRWFVGRANPNAELGAVVLIVRVISGVALDVVKFSTDGLKLQVLSAGKFEQFDEGSGVEPVRPPSAANERSVVPDLPGLAIAITDGLGVTMKVPPTRT